MRGRHFSIEITLFFLAVIFLPILFPNPCVASSYDNTRRTFFDDLVWLADSSMELWPDPGTLNWNWGEASFMYGMLRAAEITGHNRYVTYVREYLDSHIDKDGNLDVNILYPDRIAPAIATLGMLIHSEDPRYRTVCDRLAEWLMYEAPRAKNGGWFHLPVLDWQYVDTLFMTTVFLAGYGRYLSNNAYVQEALDQHTRIAENLYSEVDRLYWHGWDQDGLFCYFATPCRHHNTAFWGRGNGWAVAALSRVLALAGPDYFEYKSNLEILEEVLQRLTELQDQDSGHWYTVIDVPDGPCNYEETTATALIVEAYHLATRHGLVPPPPQELIRNGSNAVRERIVEDCEGLARVVGASIGTNPCGYWGYVLTPTWPDRYWGVGATLLMLAELAAGDTCDLIPKDENDIK
jgi:unsaturated rhamnogalacturonyl hydrolase